MRVGLLNQSFLDRRAIRHLGSGYYTSAVARAFVESSGIVIDPFAYIAPEKQKSFFSKEGWTDKKNQWKGHWKSGISAAHIQKNCPGFRPKTFPTIANKILERFIASHATANFADLMQVTTDSLYGNLKQSLAEQHRVSAKKKGKSRHTKDSQKQHVKAAIPPGGACGGGRVAFQLLGFSSPTMVLQMRHFYKGGKGWGQVTCELQPRRKPVLVDVFGKVIEAGDEDILLQQDGEDRASNTVHKKEILNTAICVYEVSFQDPQKAWKICSIQELGMPRFSIS